MPSKTASLAFILALINMLAEGLEKKNIRRYA